MHVPLCTQHRIATYKAVFVVCIMFLPGCEICILPLNSLRSHQFLQRYFHHNGSFVFESRVTRSKVIFHTLSQLFCIYHHVVYQHFLTPHPKEILIWFHQFRNWFRIIKDDKWTVLNQWNFSKEILFTPWSKNLPLLSYYIFSHKFSHIYSDDISMKHTYIYGAHNTPGQVPKHFNHMTSTGETQKMQWILIQSTFLRLQLTPNYKYIIWLGHQIKVFSIVHTNLNKKNKGQLFKVTKPFFCITCIQKAFITELQQNQKI